MLRTFPIQDLVDKDENGLTFLDVPGMISRRRDIEGWMCEILISRLERIPREEGREVGMLILRALSG